MKNKALYFSEWSLTVAAGFGLRKAAVQSLVSVGSASVAPKQEVGRVVRRQAYMLPGAVPEQLFEAVGQRREQPGFVRAGQPAHPEPAWAAVVNEVAEYGFSAAPWRTRRTHGPRWVCWQSRARR